MELQSCARCAFFIFEKLRKMLCTALWLATAQDSGTPRLRVASPFDGQALSWDPLRTSLRVLVEIDGALWGHGVEQQQQQHQQQQQQLCLSLRGMAGELCAPHPPADSALPLVLEHLRAGKHELRAELRSLGGGVLAAAGARFAVRHDAATEPTAAAFRRPLPLQQQPPPPPAPPLPPPPPPPPPPAVVLLSVAELEGPRAARGRLRHLVRDGFDARSGATLRRHEAFAAAPGGGSCALLAYLGRALPRAAALRRGGHRGGALAVEVVARASPRFGASAFALGAAPSTSVFSYGCGEAAVGAVAPGGGRAAAVAARNGLTAAALALAAPNVAFRSRPALRELGSVLRRAQLVFLDASAAAEAPVLLRALLGLGGFRGVVVCDGIYASSAVARWWQAVGEEGVAGGALLEKYDVSPLGDGSAGTGLLDFGGLVRFAA
jgi:hypothetical protein